jgi:plastocyanin
MPAGVGVQTNNLNFSPVTVTVVVGVNNTIVWTNQDSVIHNVDFQSGPAGFTFPVNWQPLPNLKNGQSTNPITLTVPGTYTYVCDYHSWMKATIIVVAA